jgi:hypothetical protein
MNLKCYFIFMDCARKKINEEDKPYLECFYKFPVILLFNYFFYSSNISIHSLIDLTDSKRCHIAFAKMLLHIF